MIALNNDELNEVLDDLQREDELRSAFIAGVRKGVEVVQDDRQYTRGEFNTEIRAAFLNWLEEAELEKNPEGDTQ